MPFACSVSLNFLRGDLKRSRETTRSHISREILRGDSDALVRLYIDQRTPFAITEANRLRIGVYRKSDRAPNLNISLILQILKGTQYCWIICFVRA